MSEGKVAKFVGLAECERKIALLVDEVARQGKLLDEQGKTLAVNTQIMGLMADRIEALENGD